MYEDEIYRTSSQYRLWSFTEESLRTIRANTNAVASERVRAALRRSTTDAKHTTPRSGSGTPNPAGDADDSSNKTPEMAGKNGEQTEREIECLTPEEELELVRYYCEKTMELGDEYKPPLPTVVRATAIQYLRRFYLSNSPMTYHPKSIMPCALFLATKTENYYMSLRSFAEHIPNSTPEDIIAPEYLLTQGLRFTFDVRHPFRSLEGGIMELGAIANGNGAPGPYHPEQVSAGLQQSILSLPPPPPSPANPNPKEVLISSRLAKAHHNAREILRSAAQMTDVYFLYTPSQIWLSALLLVDKPLAQFYIDTKLVPTDPQVAANAAAAEPRLDSPATKMFASLRAKLSLVLDSCSTSLSTYQTNHTPATTPATMKNLKRIGKKLYHCQNPEKMDLKSLSRAARREGSSAALSMQGVSGPVDTDTVAAAGDVTAGADAVVDASTSASAEAGAGVGSEEDAELQRAAKKRKLEREKFEKEGGILFGGDLMEERKRIKDV
ncbi:hypothetical protein ACO22_00872 [Paracoccidioides brasiliensis]|uniref:Cyclin-like domain-containing protein n=1 Tax=Paracoccidioides brasiliensis TaxID=121759 RepID=A0A1D2JN70_PARBR|nr:hypothetical protein ACO22_00872 [Paracoccidioides brasiliensis]ODH52178.1 hypothetical protein GX48_01735 [Paracoccidioides brasiliensis]